MSISIEAYSPADGAAIIRKEGQCFWLNPPYQLINNTINVKKLDDAEKTINEALIKQNFHATDQTFENWEHVFSFLRHALQTYREKLGRPVPEQITGVEFINSMPEAIILKLLERIKTQYLPQQRFIPAKNFLFSLLESQAARDNAELKAKAQALLKETQLAEQALLIPATIDLSPDVQIRLKDSVKRISPDGQQLFINWLVSGIESQQWDVPKLMVILQDEPLELISDDDVIINIVAQVLRSAVVLFDTRKWRRLLKMLINQLICHLKTVDGNRDWDNDFFDIAMKCNLDEWAVESLPKLVILEEINNEVFIKIWCFLILCLQTEEIKSSIFKAESSYALLKMSKENFEPYKEYWKEVESKLLNYDICNAHPVSSERRAIKLHIISIITNECIYIKNEKKPVNVIKKLYDEIQGSKDTDDAVSSVFARFIDNLGNHLAQNNTPHYNA